MVVAGTGHRPDKLGGYGPNVNKRLEYLAELWLSTHDVSVVISGMALGWDQALAAAAVKCNISFIAALPFKDQAGNWPLASAIKFDKLCREASEVVIVSEGGYDKFKMQIRNAWMVDKADLVLALWDGSRGGTDNCVCYAEDTRTPIINLWPWYGSDSIVIPHNL